MPYYWFLMRAAGHVVLGVCDPQLRINKTPSWEGLHVISNDAASKAIWQRSDCPSTWGYANSATGRYASVFEATGEASAFLLLVTHPAWFGR